VAENITTPTAPLWGRYFYKDRKRTNNVTLRGVRKFACWSLFQWSWHLTHWSHTFCCSQYYSYYRMIFMYLGCVMFIWHGCFTSALILLLLNFSFIYNIETLAWRNVCSFWLTNNISFTVCKYVHNLPTPKYQTTYPTISVSVSVLQASADACNTETTPTQPHRISNTHRTMNTRPIW